MDNRPFDARDEQILASRINAWNKVQGPRVGDFVLLAPGDLRRFTHDWGDIIQTTIKGNVDVSFYFGSAYMDFSGSLDHAVPKAKLRDTGEIRQGTAWFFHHHHVQAHNGVHFSVPCRVFEVTHG